MKARFVGDPNDNSSGPSEIVHLGVTFKMNEWADVAEDVAAKLATNNHFEVKAPASKRPAAVSDVEV